MFDLDQTVVNTECVDPRREAACYLPFGEELYAGTGGRTTTQGYSGDSVRQKFTQYERDIETILDYAQARFYARAQGRFISLDPLRAAEFPRHREVGIVAPIA